MFQDWLRVKLYSVRAILSHTTLPPMYSFLPPFSVVSCLWIVVSFYKSVKSGTTYVTILVMSHASIFLYLANYALELGQRVTFFPEKVTSLWSYLDTQTSCVCLIALNILLYHCFASSINLIFSKSGTISYCFNFSGSPNSFHCVCMCVCAHVCVHALTPFVMCVFTCTHALTPFIWCVCSHVCMH